MLNKGDIGMSAGYVREESGRMVVVAVAGQPNTGKSTIFNKLTGLNQRVGNWPGKTVDRKEGTARCGECAYLFVDLPGTYGLTANSAEEEIASNYLASGAPDAVLAVVNAACLERSMYLVAEMMRLDIPVVLALNMLDVAEQEGRAVDPAVLSFATGLPVVGMVGTDRGQSMDPIFEALAALDPPPAVGAQQPAAPPFGPGPWMRATPCSACRTRSRGLRRNCWRATAQFAPSSRRVCPLAVRPCPVSWRIPR